MASIETQIKCIEYFRDNLDWCDYMCAALVGCVMNETNLSPSYINKKLKDIGQPYNVGILPWKYTDKKEESLIYGLGISRNEAKEILKTNGIESLSLDNQLKMILYDIKDGIYKTNFLKSMLKTNNLREAVATVYCRFMNGYSIKTNIPNNNDINRLDKYYNNINTKNISKYQIYLRCAEKVLDNYHQSIDI